MSIVIYSLSGDFGGNFDPGIFAEELRASTITTVFQSILEEGDDVTFKFKGILSGAEMTTLNALVAAHDPDENIDGKRRLILSPAVQSTRNKSYTQLGTFSYNGILYDDTIDSIEFFSWSDNGVSSYDIRVVDITNKEVIGEVTGLSNTVMELNDLGTISTLPLEPAELEIQAKKNGGGNGNRFVYVSKVNFYFSS